MLFLGIREMRGNTNTTPLFTIFKKTSRGLLDVESHESSILIKPELKRSIHEEYVQEFEPADVLSKMFVLQRKYKDILSSSPPPKTIHEVAKLILKQQQQHSEYIKELNSISSRH